MLMLVSGATLLAILVWRNDPEAILHSTDNATPYVVIGSST